MTNLNITKMNPQEIITTLKQAGIENGKIYWGTYKAKNKGVIIDKTDPFTCENMIIPVVNMIPRLTSNSKVRVKVLINPSAKKKVNILCGIIMPRKKNQTKKDNRFSDSKEGLPVVHVDSISKQKKTILPNYTGSIYAGEHESGTGVINKKTNRIVDPIYE